MEKLIKKIIEEAEEKSRKIIEEANNHLESEWKKKKKEIDLEYEKKIELMKKNIDREISNDIVNFKLEKQKDILAAKNELIRECEEKIKGKFNQYLNENMQQIIKSILSKTDEKDLKIFIPEDKELKVDGYTVEKKKDIKDKFQMEGKKWSIEFSWDIIKNLAGQELRKNISEKLLNGQEKST